MTAASRSLGDEESPTAPSAAQARIIAAALDLFARHGVGDHLQGGPADEIGVTKAAVYHQYNAKDEIVLAAAEAELARLHRVISAAETAGSPTRVRDALIDGIVDLAVTRRRTVGALLGDPVLGALFVEHESFRDVMARLHRILIGGDTGPEGRVRLAMLVAALSGAVIHAFVVDLDDDTLRPQLRRLARRFLGLPR